ncbi:hypothetical protein AKH19_06660 [Pelagibacteraceae bacterium GOM-A1]|nr:hypothetical protein AKH19_06660 [Pelagibacteraceae bacterium GOM-A1]
MNNYRNNRKNRFKSSGDRNFRKRPLNGHKNQNDFSNHSEFRHRNPGRNNQNAGKLIDKYNNLAREALSSGDKILSENYLQHADHFSRVLSLQEVSKSTEEKNNIIEQNFSKLSKDTNDKKDNISNLDNLDTD